jgi:hypothetical protein
MGNTILSIITLISGLSISGIAAYYSIVGLTAIFAASFWPVVIMGSALEVGKLVAISWLYNYWHKAPILIKTYFIFAIAVLMFITSMGIFGFLSRAHIEQTLSNSNSDIEIVAIDTKIEREQKRIDSNQKVMEQLDGAVQVLTEAQRIRGRDGAIAVREAQQEQRDAIQAEIDKALDAIQKLNEEKKIIEIEQVKLEAEVGPIKYVAEMIFGESDKEIIERSIRYVIVILIFVFDPLAVLLMLAFNMGVSNRNKPLTNLPEPGILTIDDKFLTEGVRNVTKRKTNKKQHNKSNGHADRQ